MDSLDDRARELVRQRLAEFNPDRKYSDLVDMTESGLAWLVAAAARLALEAMKEQAAPSGKEPR